MASSVERKEISGEAWVEKTERVQVTCPACGQQIEAVARDGRISGYCAVTNQYVAFPIEIQPAPSGKNSEAKAKISAALIPGRDFSGRFVKGNVPKNKKV